LAEFAELRSKSYRVLVPKTKNNPRESPITAAAPPLATACCRLFSAAASLSEWPFCIPYKTNTI